MQKHNMIVICQPGELVIQSQATHKQEIFYYSITTAANSDAKNGLLAQF